MAKRIPKNNSGDVVGEQCANGDCINCWKSWLKDGDSDALD